MHGLMIAIEYSYKLDRKNYFNLWCELGRFLLRQSHMKRQVREALIVHYNYINLAHFIMILIWWFGDFS